MAHGVRAPGILCYVECSVPAVTPIYYYMKSIFQSTQKNLNLFSEARRREELLHRLQAHLLSKINKIQALLKYQGGLNYISSLALQQRMTNSLLHD